MNRGDADAVQCSVQFAPFTGGNDWPCRETKRFEHHADADRIDGKHFADQRDRGALTLATAGRRDRTLLGFSTGISEHRAGQHVLRLGMSRHAEARHIDADDAHAVDLLRQQLQRHSGRCRYTQIRDHDGIVQCGIGHLEHSVANVFEQLARNERFRIERDVANGATRAVEVRGECQPVHAAGRS